MNDFFSSNIRSKLRYIFTIALVVGSYYYLYTFIDFGRMAHVLITLDVVPFLLAICLFYVTVPIRTWRWDRLLSELEIDTETAILNGIVFVSLYFNTILPAKSGDVYRCYLVGDNYGGRKSTIFGTVVFTRTIDILFLIVVFAFTALLIFQDRVVEYATRHTLVLTIVLLVTPLLLYVGYRAYGHVPIVVRRYLDEFRQGFISSRDPSVLASVVVSTVVLWSANVFRLGAITVAVDLSLQPVEIILIAVLITLLAGLPYTPAGIGVVEVLTTSTLVSIGVDSSTALAFVVLDRTITIVTLVVFGSVYYVYLKHWGVLDLRV